MELESSHGNLLIWKRLCFTLYNFEQIVYILYSVLINDMAIPMKTSELLEIAKEACAYAREHIKQGETTPRIKFYKKSAALLDNDLTSVRKEELKNKYAERYNQRKSAGYYESSIFHNLQYLDRVALANEVADIRKQADELWMAFCALKGVEEDSTRGQSIRRHCLELCVLEKKIGNCGEFATLAFHYIQKMYPEQLEEMNLTVLGVNINRHVVVSLGKDEDRVICDPTLNLVFELNKEPEKLHSFSQSRGKNTYYPYNPEFDTLNPLVNYSPEGMLSREEIEELNQFKIEQSQAVSPSSTLGKN
ncbi:hypothetical protein HBNCFIEN_02945 [Legionella sp. PC997]|nr:hypothetical protein HBNCFIEN_02945 [Legionella sp. PC997]